MRRSLLWMRINNHPSRKWKGNQPQQGSPTPPTVISRRLPITNYGGVDAASSGRRIMPSRVFDFESPKGYRLSGRIEHPGTTPRGWALLAHCFTCGKESLAAVRLARALPTCRPQPWRRSSAGSCWGYANHSGCCDDRRPGGCRSCVTSI